MRHRIDELRKEAGMTQDTYGREILHCSQGTASQKLSGQLALSALDIFRLQLHSMFLRIICMASLTHVLERMQKKEKPLWHLHRSSEIESVDELQFASGRRMKPSSISQTNNRKETERQTGIRTVNRGEPDSHSPRQPRNV